MKSLITIGCLFLILISCSVKKEEVSSVFAPFSDYLEIEKIRTKKPIDFKTIKKIYLRKLKSDIMPFSKDDDIRIENAIVLGLKGDKPHVRSQEVSKILQKVYFLKLKEIALSSSVSVDNLKKYYAILEPTVVRRSEWIGKGREFPDKIENIFKKLDIEKEDVKRKILLSDLINIIADSYILSIYYEFEGIENNRGNNTDKCEEKEVEARLFFETISSFIQEDSIALEFKKLLDVDYKEMDIEQLRKLGKEIFPNIKLKK